jgi:hypothetical protein
MPLRLPIVSKFDDRGIRDARTGLDRLGSFARGAGAVLAGAFAGMAIGAGAFAASSVRAADESFRIGKGLENAIKNAGVFGTTEKDISTATDALKKHADALGTLIGVDDEVILSMERTWMAVPELAAMGIPGIERLATVTADVAAGTGKDIESIGGAFIKIAGDEETALSKLARMGIVFTDQQKEQYQAFLDANDQVGAQTYLIGELENTYKGAGEAMASPLARIGKLWGDLQETVGEALMPALEKVVPILATALASMTADPAFQQFLVDISNAFVDMLPSVTDILPSLMDLIEVLLPALIELTPAIIASLQFVADMFSSTSKDGGGLKDIVSALSDGLIWLIGAIQDTTHWFAEQKKAMEDGKPSIFIITGLIGGLATAFYAVQQEIQNTITWWNELWGIQQAKPVSGTTVQTYRPGGLKLAAGGVVMPKNGGTLATIGEAGQAEAVIPLDRLDRMINGGGGGATYVVNVNGGLNTSAEIGRAVVDAIKKFERTSGPVFASA